jgi:hypothetical protein
MYSPPSGPSPSTRSGFILFLVAAAAVFVRTQTLVDPPSGESFDASHYAVTLDLDVTDGTITGKERIELTMRAAAAVLVLDIGALALIRCEAAARDSFPAECAAVDRHPAGAGARGRRRALDIAYHGAPRTGLTLLAEERPGYTTFSTSQWMPAVDAPADRATLDLEVSMPAGWRAAGSGREVERRSRDGRAVYRWRQTRETASFLFGFVAGNFAEATARRGNVVAALSGLGRFRPGAPSNLPRHAGHARLLRRARRPAVSGRQLHAGARGDERRPGARGLSHMSEAYGASVFDDVTATGLMAHELAHNGGATS